jgi:inner membrane protein involved in colicin E2 resistance
VQVAVLVAQAVVQVAAAVLLCPILLIWKINQEQQAMAESVQAQVTKPVKQVQVPVKAVAAEKAAAVPARVDREEQDQVALQVAAQAVRVQVAAAQAVAQAVVAEAHPNLDSL